MSKNIIKSLPKKPANFRLSHSNSLFVFTYIMYYTCVCVYVCMCVSAHASFFRHAFICLAKTVEQQRRRWRIKIKINSSPEAARLSVSTVHDIVHNTDKQTDKRRYKWRFVFVRSSEQNAEKWLFLPPIARKTTRIRILEWKLPSDVRIIRLRAEKSWRLQIRIPTKIKTIEVVVITATTTMTAIAATAVEVRRSIR